MTKKQETTAKAKAAKEVKDPEVKTRGTTDQTKSPAVEKDSQKEPEIKKPFSAIEDHLNAGGLAKIEGWGGFWFKDIKDPEKTFVMTKENKILDTPEEKYKDQDGWVSAEATDEQSEVLEKYWSEKEIAKADKEANKEIVSLKAIGYNKAKGGSFIKLKKADQISIEDLQKRDNLPSDSSRTSEFVMDNDFVFDLESGTLTNKKVEKI